MAKAQRKQSKLPGTQQIVMSFACPEDLAQAIGEARSAATKEIGREPTLSALLVHLLRQRLNRPAPGYTASDFLRD